MIRKFSLATLTVIVSAGAANAEAKWFACYAHVDGNKFVTSETFEHDIGAITTDARGGSNEMRQWQAAKSDMELAWLRYLHSRFSSVTAPGCTGPHDSHGEAASNRDELSSYGESRVETDWSF